MPRTPPPAVLPTSPARCPAPTSRNISTPAASAPWQQLCESQPRGTLGGWGGGVEVVSYSYQNLDQCKDAVDYLDGVNNYYTHTVLFEITV